MVISEIKQRVSIEKMFEQLFSSNELTRKGNKLWTRCPFHADKTPSFTINPVTQKFYCFSCHASGDAIDLFAQANGLDPKQAIKALAEQLGISADISPQAKSAAKKAQEQRDNFRIRENWARTIMREQYDRLCGLEKACYKIIDSIKSEPDLDRIEVIEAFHAKDKIEYWLNEWQSADDDGRLELALMLTGTAL